MTKVFLYHNAPERLAAAVSLIGRVARQKKSILVYAPDEALASALDRQLWIDPPTGFTPHVFAAALGHEQRVSESIRELYRTGEAEGDLDSRPLLNWFLEEQIEEESTVSEILAQIRMVGDDGPGLLRLDADLGSRQSQGTEPA